MSRNRVYTKYIENNYHRLSSFILALKTAKVFTRTRVNFRNASQEFIIILLLSDLEIVRCSARVSLDGIIIVLLRRKEGEILSIYLFRFE